MKLELGLVARVVGASVREPGSLLVTGVKGEVAMDPDGAMPLPVRPGVDVVLAVVALSEREYRYVVLELTELVIVALAEGSPVADVRLAVVALSEMEVPRVIVVLIELVIIAEGSPLVAIWEMETLVPIVPVLVLVTELGLPEPVGSGMDGNE